MSISFRTFNPEPLFGKDYYSIRNFLIRINSCNCHFGRWDWMITHGNLDATGLERIGIWEDNGMVVALATYDTRLGKALLLTAEGYEHLFEAMLLYAEEALQKDGMFAVNITDGNLAFQQVAAKHGFIATQEKEADAIFLIASTSTEYALPEGFRIVSMAEQFDLYKYGQVLWKGFNHEARGEGPFVFERYSLEDWQSQWLRPNLNMDLKVAAVAPNGDFVSYCGMWYDPLLPYALVEPVATDPAYRLLGLGKAVVLEAVKRCAALGAEYALVGSAQQFYYSIGFKPFSTSTYWEKRKRE